MNFSLKNTPLLFAVAILCATSCFDSQYDDMEVSTEVQLWSKGVTIPIGSTSPMFFSDFIDLGDEAGMSLNSDGVYTLTQSGSTEKSIDPIREEGIEIEISPSDIEIETSKLGTGVPTLTISIDRESTELNINTDLPDEIEELKYLTLNEGSIIELNLEIREIDDEVGDISYDQFTVEFPDYLVFATDGYEGYDNDLIDFDTNTLTLDDNPITTYNSDGKFKVSETINTTRSWIGQFKIDAIDFRADKYADIIDLSDPDDKRLVVAGEEVCFEGDITIEDATTQVGSALEFDIQVDVSSLDLDNDNSMVVREVEGEFKIDVNIDPTDINLGDALGDDMDITAQLSNPTIEMVATNELEMDIEVSGFALTPQDSDGEAILSDMSSIEGITSAGAISVDTFIIPAKSFDYPIEISINGGTADNQVSAPALGYLLTKGTPSNIEILIDAAIADVDAANEDWHIIDLMESHNIAFDYMTILPMEFESMYMDMSTTIDDLSSSLSEFGDLLTNVAFLIEATNTQSLDFNIESIEPIDSNGETITSGFEPIIDSAVSIAAGEQTEFNINLNSGGDANKFGELDGLRLNLSITGEVEDGESASITDNEDEYLQFTLKISLPDGLIVNLGDDEDDEDIVYEWDE